MVSITSTRDHDVFTQSCHPCSRAGDSKSNLEKDGILRELTAFVSAICHLRDKSCIPETTISVQNAELGANWKRQCSLQLISFPD